ncbi:MAG: MFS transporter [Candidatus Hodarchaeota archaeon]
MLREKALNLTVDRRLFLMKFYGYISYTFEVCSFPYIGMLMAKLGLKVEQFFLVSIVSVLVSLISQNTLSRLSDKLKDRIPFIVTSKFLFASSILVLVVDYSFFMIIVTAILRNILSGETLSAAIVYELIDEKQKLAGDTVVINKSKEFSKFRVFGSMGWAFTAPFAGFIITQFNNMDMPIIGYQLMFLISGVGLIGVAFFLYFVLLGYGRKKNQVSQNKTVEEENSRFYFKIPYLMLVCSIFIFAIANSLQGNVFTKYVDMLGGTEFFYGILAFTWATSEVPLMFLSSRFVKKHDWKPVIILAYSFYMIKSLTYTFVVDSSFLWFLIPMQFFNSFGMSYPAYSYAITNEIAPKRKALALSLRQTIVQLGSFTGGLIGLYVSYLLGNISETIAGFRVFFMMAFVFGALAITTFVILYLIDKLRKNKDKTRT